MILVRPEPEMDKRSRYHSGSCGEACATEIAPPVGPVWWWQATTLALSTWLPKLTSYSRAKSYASRNHKSIERSSREMQDFYAQNFVDGWTRIILIIATVRDQIL